LNCINKLFFYLTDFTSLNKRASTLKTRGVQHTPLCFNEGQSGAYHLYTWASAHGNALASGERTSTKEEVKLDLPACPEL